MDNYPSWSGKSNPGALSGAVKEKGIDSTEEANLKVSLERLVGVDES